MMTPDLRTIDGALRYLEPVRLDNDGQDAVDAVNRAVEKFTISVWGRLPDGPGKTRAIHAIKAAQMACNACISYEGA